MRGVQGIEGFGLSALTPAIPPFGVVSEPATVNGVEVVEEPSIGSLPEAPTSGSWSGLERRRNGAVLGIQLAERPSFCLSSLLVAVAVCALAAVGTARRAARLDPTAILRGER